MTTLNRLRRWREVNSRPYRETLQTTGFYMGRIVIVTREFASIPSPPPRGLREYSSPDCVFSGMAESIGPMGLLKPKPIKPEGRYRLPLVGPDPQSKDATGGTTAPCSSSAMSSDRLFLDRVARQHCPSPLHRHTHTTMHSLPAPAKQDISTLQGIGHFYFALTGREHRMDSEDSYGRK